MNHKNSWAEENRSPKKENYIPELIVAENTTPTKRILIQSRPAINSNSHTYDSSEILIVASKLKQYIKDKYDMNTSANVMEILSNDVRRLTDKAVEKARSEGRKTLMDRDYE
jgi:LytS/YehU family sensor histidine kinase